MYSAALPTFNYQRDMLDTVETEHLFRLSWNGESVRPLR